MNYEVQDYDEYSDVIDGYRINPENKLYFIPENFEEENNSENFIYSETTSEIRKLFLNENQRIVYLTNDKPSLRMRKNSDWFGPAILITSSILSENPRIIDVSLSLISSYLYDLFKGKPEDKKVQFDIIIGCKGKKGYKKISYKGNVEGITALTEVIYSLKK